MHKKEKEKIDEFFENLLEIYLIEYENKMKQMKKRKQNLLQEIQNVTFKLEIKNNSLQEPINQQYYQTLYQDDFDFVQEEPNFEVDQNELKSVNCPSCNSMNYIFEQQQTCENCNKVFCTTHLKLYSQCDHD